MTADEMNALTLSDIERIAERFTKACNDIRAAQALLGFATQGSQALPAAPLVAVANHPSSIFTPAEMAERARLKRQFTEGLPEDVQAAERA